MQEYVKHFGVYMIQGQLHEYLLQLYSYIIYIDQWYGQTEL